jgi:hypothetical protein
MKVDRPDASGSPVWNLQWCPNRLVAAEREFDRRRYVVEMKRVSWQASIGAND